MWGPLVGCNSAVLEFGFSWFCYILPGGHCLDMGYSNPKCTICQPLTFFLFFLSVNLYDTSCHISENANINLRKYEYYFI